MAAHCNVSSKCPEARTEGAKSHSKNVTPVDHIAHASHHNIANPLRAEKRARGEEKCPRLHPRVYIINKTNPPDPVGTWFRREIKKMFENSRAQLVPLENIPKSIEDKCSCGVEPTILNKHLRRWGNIRPFVFLGSFLSCFHDMRFLCAGELRYSTFTLWLTHRCAHLTLCLNKTTNC